MDEPCVYACRFGCKGYFEKEKDVIDHETKCEKRKFYEKSRTKEGKK